MRFLIFAVSVAAVLLAGCSKPAGYSRYASEKTDARLIRPPPGGAKDGSDPAEASAPLAPSAPMLAYAYAFGLEVPPQKLPALVARHQAACASAGASVCQMTGSTLERQGRDQVHATLTLRATPAWLGKFRDGLAHDAEGAGGRVVQANVTSEDLSREVTDTAAAIRAKTTLRDRLQAILDTRPGKTADLVDAETALAKVQGELDATQSEMAMMRQRLDSSVITIEYQSAAVLAPDSVWSPLANAVAQFASTAVAGLAFLITCIAALLPWVVVVGGALWVFRRPMARVKWPWRRKGRPD